jgi:iron complex transport system ATP-binding protein
VGAIDLADRYVHELSDGERQKIMIARALAQEPAVMLLDEPTAFLDLPRRVEILYLLRTLARETQRAILLSTHDLDLALRCADQVWLMTQDGKINTGSPEDLVLSGAFGRAFASMGAHFDGETGTFSISAPSIGAVNLVGEGTTALWTARALEREGFHLDPMSKTVIEVDGEQQRWKTTIGGTSTEHASIYHLLIFLKTRGAAHEPVHER